MIPRYSRPEMAGLWEAENRYRAWLAVEILACEANAKLGLIPTKALANIRKKADFNVRRIDALEKIVKHDVIAFLTAVGEHVGPDSRYIHLGLTSSDVLDTALALQTGRALDKVIAKGKVEAMPTAVSPISRQAGINWGAAARCPFPASQATICRRRALLNCSP